MWSFTIPGGGVVSEGSEKTIQYDTAFIGKVFIDALAYLDFTLVSESASHSFEFKIDLKCKS